MDDGEATLFGLIAGALGPSPVARAVYVATNQLCSEDLRHREPRCDVQQREGRAIVIGRLVGVAGDHRNFEPRLSGLASHLDHFLGRGGNVALQRPYADCVVSRVFRHLQEFVIGNRLEIGDLVDRLGDAA